MLALRYHINESQHEDGAMRPVEFSLQNTVYAKDQPEYLPLPAYRTPDVEEVTACWGMSWRERIRVLLTGRVYVTLLTFGKPLTPSIVSTEPPEVGAE